MIFQGIYFLQLEIYGKISVVYIIMITPFKNTLVIFLGLYK